MNVKWFPEPLTAQEVKDLYRKLCFLYHPDLHPENPAATATMQEINAEYTQACARAQRRERPEWSEEKFNWAAQVDEILRQKIEQIINIPDIEIEVCGAWIWVGGNTRPVKDILYSSGFSWAGQKKKWYYAGVPASNRGHWSMDQIRSHYGSQKVTPGSEEKSSSPAPALK